MAPDDKRRPRAKKGDGAADVADAIAEMSEHDRAIAERLHALILASAPELIPRLWYGMPAYAKDGKVVLFFRGAEKFKERYMTLGFNQPAKLDDGHMWPVAFALTELTAPDEERIADLVRQAAR